MSVALTPRRSLRRAALLVGLATVSWCAPAILHGQEPPCDPYLKPVQGDPNGYRVRGDRCEGIYVKEVANATLQIVSFTGSFADYDQSSGKELLIEWSAAGDGSVRLRAYSLRRRLYYRMDTVRPQGSRAYVWPSGMLAVFGLTRPEIGMVGVIEQTVGGVRREVLVPLTVRPRGEPVAPRTLELVIYPTVELREVFVSLVPVGPRGAPGMALMKDAPLGYGYYPAEHAVTIKLADLASRGLHVLEIGATLRQGGSTTTSVWFHNDGG